MASAMRTVSSTGLVMLRVMRQAITPEINNAASTIAAVTQRAVTERAADCERVSASPLSWASCALSMPLVKASILGSNTLNSSALAASPCCARCKRLNLSKTTSTPLL